MLLERVFFFNLEVSAAVSVLLALALLFSQRIEQRYTVRCQYILWLVLSIRLLIPLNRGLPFYGIKLLAPYHMTLPAPPGEVGMPLFPMTAQSGLSLSQLLTSIWLIGGGCYFVYHVLCYSVQKNRLRRWSAPVTDRDTLTIFHRIRCGMGIYDTIPLERCPLIQSPMLTGVMHPRILIPDCPLSERQLEMIFRHELVHYRSRHQWYKLMLLCAGTLHWFNPFVHGMIHAAYCSIEFSCDSKVVQKQPEPFVHDYAQSILEVAKLGCMPRHCGVFSTCMANSKTLLRRRFDHLLRVRSRRKGWPLLGGVALCCILLSSCFVFRGCDQTLGLARSLSPDRIQSVTLVQDGREIPCSRQFQTTLGSWLRQVRLERTLMEGSSDGRPLYHIRSVDGKELSFVPLDSGEVLLNGLCYRSFV